MNIPFILFDLLIILLPSQLGRHFFFDFSQISGIYSDYLVPTIYLTDIISLLIIFLYILQKVKSQKSKVKITAQSLKFQVFKNKFLILTSLFLILNSAVIASNKYVALYKLAKILEFILLGWVIIRLKPKKHKIIFFLSIGTVYTSILAVWQFVTQKSAGGAWWFLGERTFNASTPAIAAIGVNHELILRSYATFPHPNVLGGFLAVMLTWIFYVFFGSNMSSRLKSWYGTVFTLGLAGLFFSFSRLAWMIFIGGTVSVLFKEKLFHRLQLKKNIGLFMIIFYFSIFLSVIIMVNGGGNVFNLGQSIIERQQVMTTTVEMVLANLIFGTGLNNSLLQIKNFIKNAWGLYFFQPVHNIYVYVLAETGLVGLSILLLMLNRVIRNLAKNPLVFILFSQLLLIGLFDHYLFTLQQGMLLFTVITSMALIPMKRKQKS